MIETLTVLAIIGILAAVGLPQIMNYMRHFRIRGAIGEVTGALQQARIRAVTKSAQHGVIFATENPTTYWVHIEDDQRTPTASDPRQGVAQPLNVATPVVIQSTRYQLPDQVVFATTAQCNPVPAFTNPAGFTPNTASLRFTRMGGNCVPGTAPCANFPSPAPTLTNFIATVNAGASARICLLDQRSGLSRWVRIDRGGRVEAQR